MVAEAIGLQDLNVGLTCVSAAVAAAGVRVDVHLPLRVTPLDLLRQCVGVMRATDLVNDQQAVALPDGDDGGHVADVKVNANPQRFAAGVWQVGRDVLAAVKAVIDLTSGEVDKLAVEVGTQQLRVVVGLQSLNEVRRQVGVVSSAHLNELAVGALLGIITAECVPHPPETLGRAGRGKLPDIA